MTCRSMLAGFTLLGGCVDPLFAADDAMGVDARPGPVQPGMPAPQACALDPEGASTLVVTTTDFATGAITIVDTRTDEVRPDVAVGSADAIPYPAPGGVAVVHRHQHDFIDLLSAGTWRSTGQHALDADDARSPNPHAIAFDAEGLGYVTLYGSKDLLVFDPSAPIGEGIIDTIDLSAFADDDGRPEASIAVRCGDTLWVSIERIDVPGNYERVDIDQLVAIDLETRLPWDFDPETPGGQGLPLLGAWLKQVHLDPTDDGALLGLTSGLERIDLAEGSSAWLVPPEAFARVGAGHYFQPLAFDVGPQGRWAWIAAYLAPDGTDPDCQTDPFACQDHAQLFEVDLTAEPPVLVPFGRPFQAADRTVQRAGERLWVGSRETGAPGLYTYDLTTHPPTALEGPISTGLAPYSITAVTP